MCHIHKKSVAVSKLVLFVLLYSAISIVLAESVGVRVKEISRIAQARDNSLTGYGLVTGLSGTGDSLRSKATVQSISNLLIRFGIKVSPEQIRSRNVAAVMVTATLPAFARLGDKIDVNVTSLGDARSLVGGVLLLTHLNGADNQIYALAQGPVSVGGYKYDMNGNLIQKNHPTTAHIPGGAMVEKQVEMSIAQNNLIHLVLNEADFTTAQRVADSINRQFSAGLALAMDANHLQVEVPADYQKNLVKYMTLLENVTVVPDYRAKVVINERTGTVVSGGDVHIEKISVTHGDLKVAISTDYSVSQPTLVREVGDSVRTEVIPDTNMEVSESAAMQVNLPQHANVGDLVAALNKVKATSRDVISILQSIKRAGALHAELIIQ